MKSRCMFVTRNVHGALASLAAARSHNINLVGFLGAVASAMNVMIVGNKKEIKEINFCKYIKRLMK